MSRRDVGDVVMPLFDGAAVRHVTCAGMSQRGRRCRQQSDAGQSGRRGAHMGAALADEELEAVRRRGFGVAYRMLGTVTEAEDVAQEAMLRLAQTDARIDEPSGW